MHARIDPAADAPREQVYAAIGGHGADVALKFAGLPLIRRQALAGPGVHGRLDLAGITNEAFAVDSYHTVINSEAKIIGVSDHLRDELVMQMDFARRGVLDLDGVIADRVPLDATAINQRLDDLAGFRRHTRSVICP